MDGEASGIYTCVECLDQDVGVVRCFCWVLIGLSIVHAIGPMTHRLMHDEEFDDSLVPCRTRTALNGRWPRGLGSGREGLQGSNQRRWFPRHEAG